jgi:hypothetical protein
MIWIIKNKSIDRSIKSEYDNLWIIVIESKIDNLTINSEIQYFGIEEKLKQIEYMII